MTPDSLEDARCTIYTLTDERCDSRIGFALHRVADSLSTRVSLTSRNPSVWTLLQRELDPPVADLLNSTSWSFSYLRTIVPSNFGRLAAPIFDVLGSAPCEAPKRQKRLRATIANIESWDHYLVQVIEGLSEDAPTNNHSSIVGSLDSLRGLIAALRFMMPVRGRLEPVADAVQSRNPDDMHAGFCQLCWRPTVHQSKTRASAFGDEKFGYQSRRYCEYHLPMDDPPPFNRYRTDIRYKEAFLKALLFPPNRRRRSRKYRLRPPLGGDLAERRKAAYDTVHCGVVPLRSEPDNESSYSAIDLWRRDRGGRTQAEIAREFGLHRQSVSRTLKRLESIERRHANEAQIDPVTGEPFSLDDDKTWQLFEEVRRLRQQEKSTAQIAAKLDRFAWTIEALERWSDIVDSVTQSLDEHSGLNHLAKRFRISVEAVAQIQGRLRRPAQSDVATRIASSQALERVIELLSRDSVSEVYIDQPFQLEIEDGGKRYKQDVAALTPTAISKLIRTLTSEILLTEAYRTHPIRMGWLRPWGYRVTIVLPPAMQADRVRISIRKPDIPRAL